VFVAVAINEETKVSCLEPGGKNGKGCSGEIATWYCVVVVGMVEIVSEIVFYAWYTMCSVGECHLGTHMLTHWASLVKVQSSKAYITHTVVAEQPLNNIDHPISILI
jgi:hypothetical protein